MHSFVCLFVYPITGETVQLQYSFSGAAQRHLHQRDPHQVKTPVGVQGLFWESDDLKVEPCAL